MGKRVIAIGGLPATGKSTLVKSLIARLGQSGVYRAGFTEGGSLRVYQLDFTLLRAPVWVAGLYQEGQWFGGTDGMRTKAAHLLEAVKAMPDKTTLVFEGDRWFCTMGWMILKNHNIATRWVVLKTDAGLLEDRHISRGDRQSTQMLAAKVSRYVSLEMVMADKVQFWSSDTPGHRAQNLERLVSWATLPWQ